MRSSHSGISGGQSRFLGALPCLVLKTPAKIVSCIPQMTCNSLKVFLWFNTGEVRLNIYLWEKEGWKIMSKATNRYQMAPCNLLVLFFVV